MYFRNRNLNVIFAFVILFMLGTDIVLCNDSQHEFSVIAPENLSEEDGIASNIIRVAFSEVSKKAAQGLSSNTLKSALSRLASECLGNGKGSKDIRNAFVLAHHIGKNTEKNAPLFPSILKAASLGSKDNARRLLQKANLNTKEFWTAMAELGIQEDRRQNMLSKIDKAGMTDVFVEALNRVYEEEGRNIAGVADRINVPKKRLYAWFKKYRIGPWGFGRGEIREIVIDRLDWRINSDEAEKVIGSAGSLNYRAFLKFYGLWDDFVREFSSSFRKFRGSVPRMQERFGLKDRTVNSLAKTMGLNSRRFDASRLKVIVEDELNWNIGSPEAVEKLKMNARECYVEYFKEHGLVEFFRDKVENIFGQNNSVSETANFFGIRKPKAVTWLKKLGICPNAKELLKRERQEGKQLMAKKRVLKEEKAREERRRKKEEKERRKREEKEKGKEKAGTTNTPGLDDTPAIPDILNLVEPEIPDVKDSEDVAVTPSEELLSVKSGRPKKSRNKKRRRRKIKLKEGSEITHKAFGDGVVTSITSLRDSGKITVRFAGNEEKVFSVKYSKDLILLGNETTLGDYLKSEANSLGMKSIMAPLLNGMKLFFGERIAENGPAGSNEETTAQTQILAKHIRSIIRNSKKRMQMERAVSRYL